MASVGQMNSDLMRSSGLQFAFDDRVRTDRFDWADMRNSPLRAGGNRWGNTSAMAIAAIADQIIVEGLRRKPALHDGRISTIDGMTAKQLAKRIRLLNRKLDSRETTLSSSASLFR